MSPAVAGGDARARGAHPQTTERRILPTGTVLIGGSGPAPSCAPNTITGAVTRDGNTQGVTMAGNTIVGARSGQTCVDPTF